MKNNFEKRHFTKRGLILFVVCFINVFLVIFACLTPNLTVKALNDEVANNVNVEIDNEYAKNFLNTFVNEKGFKDRTAGSTGEKLSADFLAQTFFELGYQSYFSSNVDFSKTEEEDLKNEYQKYLKMFSFKFKNSDVKQSNNVSAYKPASVQTDKTVVIGAHYDDVFGFTATSDGKLIESSGAYDNGTGVATMMSIANSIKDQNLPFNVVFVAFGAEEVGLIGSYEFVRFMKAEKTNHFDNTLIMFNLDVIGAGDYLYLYTDEVDVHHDDYIRGVAKKSNIEIKQNPNTMNITLGASSFEGFNYYHVGHMSDHASFYNEGINTAFFFTLNISDFGIYGTAESKYYPSIMHTKNDTIEKMNEYYGSKYYEYMNNVAQVVVSTMVQGNAFVEAMNLSYQTKPNISFWTNSLYAGFFSLAVFVIMVAVVVFLFFYFKKKEDKLPKLAFVESQNDMPKIKDPFEQYQNNQQSEQGSNFVDPFDNFGNVDKNDTNDNDDIFKNF